MRFGVVGTSYWAQEIHATALAGAEHAELVGVWGRDPAKTDQVAQRFGITAHADPSSLFADVDAVAFSVPPDVQAALAVEAAEHGCHLLLEKPIGLTVDQADAVLDAARDRGLASIVFFTSRFDAAVGSWLEHTRATGGWTGAHAAWLGSIFHPGNPFGASPWRREYGALWDVGPHALSLVLPLLGPVVEVAAARGPGDTSHLVLGHEDGGSSTVTLSLSVPEAAARSELSVYGETGWERMPAAAGDPVRAHQAASTSLRQSAMSGEAHPCDAAFGREVVAVLERASDVLV